MLARRQYTDILVPSVTASVPRSFCPGTCLARRQHYALCQIPTSCHSCLWATLPCVYDLQSHNMDDLHVHVHVKCLNMLQYFPVPDDLVLCGLQEPGKTP